MMSLLSAMSLTVVAGAMPCDPCPPEDQAAEVHEVRLERVGGNLSIAPRIATIRAAGGLTPRVGSLLADGQESKSVVKVVIQNENGELQYADENGNVKVIHNGEPVGGDRIQRDGDTVRILGPDGGTLYEFRAGSPATGAWVIAGAEGGHATLVTQPRGRIGVYLSVTDETTRSENGVESESAVTITDVIEGSPAQEAGLQANDIVVRINGQTASEETLRTIIGETEPGHEVTLRIVRGGEPHDVTVRVGASEEVQFDQAFQGVEVHPDMEHFTIELDDLQHRMGDIQDHLIQIDPDGEWRTHLEHLGQLNPEMLQQLHEKFGEGRAFYQLHVQPFMQRRQWTEDAGPHGEAIREKVLEALRNAELNLDDNTRARIHEAVTNALEGALRNLHNVEVQVDGGDSPVLFDLMEQGEGERIMVLPEGGEWRRLQPGEMRLRATPDSGESPASAADRLRQLEERLERLEALLEQLVERQGGARLP